MSRRKHQDEIQVRIKRVRSVDAEERLARAYSLILRAISHISRRQESIQRDEKEADDGTWSYLMCEECLNWVARLLIFLFYYLLLNVHMATTTLSENFTPQFT